MVKRSSKEPKAKVLVPFFYHVTGLDTDGEYFEFEGRVKATSELVVKESINWMVKYDYNDGALNMCLIRALDGACTIDTTGITILFEEGPIPSFLNDSENGEAEIPWSTDPEETTTAKDFLADALWATTTTVPDEEANVFSKAIKAGGK